MRGLSPLQRAQHGFTLIELVMVMTILGVIGAVVAVFMKGPIDAYFDTVRRAALTDAADTAMRRISRDLHRALPNSVRSPNAQCLEFIPTKTGGRYRTEDLVSGDGTGLDFTAADSSFNMLGDHTILPADQRLTGGDVVVVYNLGIPGADAYAQENTARISGASVAGGETSIAIASTLFPLRSGSNRFQVVPAAEKVVAYVCSGGALRRTVSSSFYAAGSASSCATTGAVLANNVDCSFDYSGSDLQRNALVRMTLQITDKAEGVNMYGEVHVNNTP